ncbi:hypothetical protein [Burkholderia sp. IMCC1007]|uniref:hypothetical protein n=1 Tax=Burkholderia sp. IMCC1007 TaxID=3004104 RepID=UPI0022B533A7|nr:hypothetical protein [Burkholderia sp. IMCC1007]
MNADSNARQANDAASSDERGGEQRTVAPTRTRARVRAATSSRHGGRRAERSGGNGPITTSSDEDTGKPLWEDDSGETPPEEWS